MSRRVAPANGPSSPQRVELRDRPPRAARRPRHVLDRGDEAQRYALTRSSRGRAAATRADSPPRAALRAGVEEDVVAGDARTWPSRRRHESPSAFASSSSCRRRWAPGSPRPHPRPTVKRQLESTATYIADIACRRCGNLDCRLGAPPRHRVHSLASPRACIPFRNKSTTVRGDLHIVLRFSDCGIPFDLRSRWSTRLVTTMSKPPNEDDSRRHPGR